MFSDEVEHVRWRIVRDYLRVVAEDLARMLNLIREYRISSCSVFVVCVNTSGVIELADSCPGFLFGLTHSRCQMLHGNTRVDTIHKQPSFVYGIRLLGVWSGVMLICPTLLNTVSICRSEC